MKIAIVTNGAFPVPAVRGGAVEALVEMLLKENEIYREADITLFSIYDPLALKAGTAYPSVHFRFIRPAEHWLKLDSGIHKVAYEYLKKQNHLSYKTIFQRLDFLYQVAAGLHENDYDAVVFENQMASLWALLYKDNRKKYKGKYYFHLHNHPEKYARSEKLVSEAAKIICVSSFIGHAFASHIGIPYTDEKFAVLTNVVDEELFDPENVPEEKVQAVRDKLGTGERKVILFLGRLMEGKGVRELLQAYRILDREDTVLVIVGSFNFGNAEHSPYEEELNALIEAIGRDRVIFTGYVDHSEVPAYYLAGDVVCMPSTCEDAAPLAVIEALRMKRPLITTTMGGIPEYADPSCAIMLENDENLPQSLAEAIGRLLDDPGQRAVMSENAGEISKPRTLGSYYHNFLKILEKEQKTVQEPSGIPQVSIIVPVYNAAKYLDECITSVIRQTYPDWKLILVNDGSTDESLAVCQRYAASDSRITVIDQPNAGSFTAVGSGLKEAGTPYVMFLDADDWYEEEMVGKLYGAIVKNDADCVMAGYKKIAEDGTAAIPLPVQDAVYEKEEIEKLILRPFFEEDADIYRRWSAPRWDKIYRTDTLKSVYWDGDPEVTVGEDLEMQLRLLQKCRRAASVSGSFHYCYRVLDASLARGYSERLKEQYQVLWDSVKKLAEENGRPFAAEERFRDTGRLNLLTELSRTSGIPEEEKKEIREKLIAGMHDKKLLYKQLLHKEFPGRETLQKIYRSVRNRKR